MYQIYSDNNLLHDDRLDSFKLHNPKLDLEINKAGKLVFSIFENHTNYFSLKKMKSIIKVYQDNDLIFRGRILDSKKGWLNEQQITCEGELAFLNDSIIRSHRYDVISIHNLFVSLLNEHNSQVETDKQFFIGEITVDNLILHDFVISENYENTLSIFNKEILNLVDGYLILRHEENGTYIDYLKNINAVSNQVIEFGKNLSNISQLISGDEICTGIIPLGKKYEETGERVTIKSVTENNVDYLVNSNHIAQYGFIFKTVIWDEITEPAELLIAAQDYLNSISFFKKSIEIQAVDISLLDNQFQSLKLGMKVKVSSIPHNIDEYFLIEKLSVDISKPESNKITLGKTIKSFVEQSLNTSSEISIINQRINNNDVVIKQNKIKLESDINILYQSFGKSLWSGSYTMKEDDVVILSENISDQVSGIVLLFSNDSEEPIFSSHFVPKNAINNSGTDFTFLMISSAIFDIFGAKQLRIFNNKITGIEDNESSSISSGVIYNNSKYTLKNIIGV